MSRPNSSHGSNLRDARAGGGAEDSPDVATQVPRKTTPLPPPAIPDEGKVPATISFQCSGCAKKLKAKGALVGKQVRFPQCRQLVMITRPAPVEAPTASAKRFPYLSAIFLSLSIIGCSAYANLSYLVQNKENYRYFPPFKEFVNQNSNDHLGAEYFNIAQAMRAGDGFANPFKERTGPTAWMPPILPAILASLLWICDGDKDAVMTIVIFFQVYVLILTGLLALALARKTTQRLWPIVAALLYLGILLCNFRLCFQNTHDSWFVLFGIDVVVAGLCWLRPFQRWYTAVVWGLLGGFCALVNPILAFTWGIMSVLVGFRDCSWSRFGLAVGVAGLSLVPWTIRNYLIFDRFIPVKSNLAYELYQSQCLQTDGLIQNTTFGGHPYASGGRERQDYKTLGEIEFVEKRKKLFWDAVWADPLDFLDRVAQRFLGVTLWYVPFNRTDEPKQDWVFFISRVTQPLPFLGMLILLFSSIWRRLHWYQWTVIGVYLLYLLPYIGASYYERYGIPVLGVKALLVIWGVDKLLSLLPWKKHESLSELQPSLQPSV